MTTLFIKRQNVPHSVPLTQIELEIHDLLKEAESMLAARKSKSGDLSKLIVELLDCASRAKAAGFPAVQSSPIRVRYPGISTLAAGRRLVRPGSQSSGLHAVSQRGRSRSGLRPSDWAVAAIG